MNKKCNISQTIVFALRLIRNIYNSGMALTFFWLETAVQSFIKRCVLLAMQIFLISNSSPIIHKTLRLIGNAVGGLKMGYESNAIGSLEFHKESTRIIANGWIQIASWVPNPLNALTLIRNNVIFFSQCWIMYCHDTSVQFSKPHKHLH